jgi:hypothetical protein
MSHAATLHDSGHDAWETPLARLQHRALWTGLIGLGGAALLAFIPRIGFDGFIRSYLFAFVFWMTIPLGSLALLMLQHLTGGTWGLTLRRFLEAASWLVLLLAVLVVPILLAVLLHRNEIYPWLPHGGLEGQFGHAANEDHLAFKKFWLAPGFFVIRAVIYFLIWGGLALYLYGWSGREDREGSTPERRWRARRVSAPGILLWGLSVSFAAIDWVMSLDPSWYSTMWGVLFIVGSGLSTLAFLIAVIALLSEYRPLRDLLSPGLLNDLGNLLMAFTMLWAYVNFSQFLIMWSGNIAEEVPYYYFRTKGAWGAIALFLVVFHFFVPFVMLLWRRVKREMRTLAMVAIALFCIRSVDAFWVVKPMFLQRDFTLGTHHGGGGEAHPPAEGTVPGATQPAVEHGAAAAEAEGDVLLAAYADPAAQPGGVPTTDRSPAGAVDKTPPTDEAAVTHSGHEVPVPGPFAAFDWTDLPALAGMGGILVAAFAWKLRQRPLLAPNDPRLAELAGAHH